MSAQQSSGPAYYLDRHATESERLNHQHILIKTFFKGQLLPPHVKLEDGASILDSATGTSIWLSDIIAMNPSLQLSRVVGCDISADQFPPESERTVGKVKLDLRTQNVLEPFSEDLIGSFDLVNQRLLVAGLKEVQWSTALENLASCLKPGGYLNIVEVVMHVGETQEIYKIANKMYQALTTIGNRANCVDGAENWMKEAGFKDVQAWRVNWEIGSAASDKDFGRASSDNILAVTTSVWEKLLANAPQLLPEEVRSEETGRQFLIDVKRTMDEHGCVAVLGMVTGRKA